jgi:argininosuccinate lyase
VRAIQEAAQRIGNVAISLDPDDLAAALDPRAIVASRSSLGGAAPAVVAAMAEKNITIAWRQAEQAKGLSENESFTSSWVIGDVPL